ELHGTDLERHACAQGRLLEDERERATGQRRAAAARFPALLEGRGGGERREGRFTREIGAGEEVVHSAPRRVSSAWSQSRSSMISGGARRTTCSPALSTMRPLSRHA